MPITQTLLLALSDENTMKLIVVAMLCAVGLVVLIVQGVKGVLRTRETEQTKRELAAYVAEGSMSPADAQRILSGGDSDFESKIGTAVTWGMISSGKAERLIKAFREDGRQAQS